MEYWESEIKLSDLMNKGIISLGRGRIISSIDLQKKPGVYPVYSSSSQKGGLFGLYDEFDFDEELLTWSVDGGGHFFYRPKHKFSVTNVSGILKINEPIFDYKFLYYSLVYQHSKEVFDYVDKAHPSVIKKRYNVPNISINEQKKIAEILTKVDEAIENTEQLIQKYEQVKVGLMQDLLTKGIDENGNIRSEETHQFKDSPLGRIPVEWDCDKLDAFLSKKQYGISLPLTDNGKYSVLRMNNIKYGELFLKDVKYTSDFFPKDLILKEGDVLFNRTNSIEHVGRTGIFRKQEGEYTFASYLVRLSPNDKLNCEFLNLLLNFNTNQERIKAIATSAVHQANVNPTNLGRLYFSIPQYDEQILIYEHLQKMTKLIIHNRQLKQKLQLQKQGLMQDLLAGKVRVNY